MKPGDKLDRYLIEALLGRGGMGEVFEALDTRLARKVALKILPSDADATATQRLLREARAAAAFQHPHAVVVYDVGEHEGVAYIAMELVRGKTLRRFVGDEGVPEKRRIRWLVETARALAAAHEAGLVHRDVKPDNVMVREDSAVKVLDFGIARRPQTKVDPSAPTEDSALPTLTEQGVVVGTPLYASPEQLRSEPLDGRSDQFSWGVMAYQLLGGVVPWHRSTDALSLLSQILSAEPEPLASLAKEAPPEVVAAVTRAMSKAARDRFATMNEVADVLEPFAEVASASARLSRDGDGARSVKAVATPVVAPTQAARIARRTGRFIFVGLAVFGGLVVALLAVAGATGHLVWDSGDKPKADASVAAAMPQVSSLACKQAQIEGEATPLMKRAIGVGACARVAIDLGVDWQLEPHALPGAPALKTASASPLEVNAKLSKGEAEITLSIGGAQAVGSGATPVEAIEAASAELVKRVEPPALDPMRVKACGAVDDASARRIERLWRRLVLNLLPNREAAVKELVAANPGSAWAHTIAAITLPRGGADAEAETKRALELVDTLPPARALGVKGLLLFIGSGEDRAAAIEMMRKAYGQAPDDADISGLFAAVAIASGSEEGWAVLDRLVAKAPTQSVLPIENAISAPSDRNAERDQRYIDELQAILPETRAWGHSVQTLALNDKIAEAREALAFGDAFGLSSGSVDAAELRATRVFVELAALRGKEARELAAPLLGDPRAEVAMQGADLTIDAYWSEGRFDDAIDAEARYVDRLRSFAGPQELAGSILSYGFALRRLGKKGLDDALLDEALKAVEGSKAIRPTQRAAMRGMIAVLRSEKDPKKAKAVLAPVLAELEKVAEATTNRDERDTLRLSTLAMTRVVKGDAEAGKLWSETPRANRWTRDGTALEAALALDHAGARAEAEAVYTHAASAINTSRPLSRLVAHLRLGELYRATGREEQAKAHDELVARAWKDVDPELLARFKKL